jgi:sugar-specific transcriptional regulator TrmB
VDIDEKNLQTMHKLGLTNLQAKIYLVSIQTGREKIKTLSLAANMDRSNTYQAVQQLQQVGLMEKILGEPNLYQAIPIENAVSTLLKSKETEYNQIQDQAKKLVEVVHSENQTAKEYEFKIMKRQKEYEIKDIVNACKSAQESFDMLINRKTFCYGVIDLAKDQLECLERGVEYRVLTEKLNTPSIKQKLEAFLQYPNFKIKFLSKTPEAELVIGDKKAAIVSLVSNSEMGESPLFLTTHPGMIKMFQSHFDKVWNETQK